MHWLLNCVSPNLNKKSLACQAVPENAQVPHIGDESVITSQRLFDGIEDILIHLEDSAAPLADEMVVMSLLRMVVVKLVATEVGLIHQTQPSEQFEGAIDGGLIYLGASGPRLGVDFLWSDVLFRPVKYIQDYRPLRCKPVTLFLQETKATHIFCQRSVVSCRGYGVGADP